MKATTLALALLPVSVVPSLRGLAAQDPPAIRDAQQVLSRLVETYGVSGTEGPVRDQEGPDPVTFSWNHLQSALHAVPRLQSPCRGGSTHRELASACEMQETP